MLRKEKEGMLLCVIYEEKIEPCLSPFRLYAANPFFWQNYNWLISDYGYRGDDKSYLPRDKTYVWMTGEELLLVLQEDSEALFEWGVFSGFQKSIEQKEIVPLSDKNLPIAEGCNVWGKDTNVCLQHPKASVELIAWDETYLIILSKDKKLVDCFMKLYPEAESLEQYNTRVFDKEKNINE